MRKLTGAVIRLFCFAMLGLSVASMAKNVDAGNQAKAHPIGKPNRAARYSLSESTNSRASSIKSFVLSVGPIEEQDGRSYQWIALETTKQTGERLRVWILGREYPPETLKAARAVTLRYILQEGNDEPKEFIHRVNGTAVLPSLGGWRYLWPRTRSERASSQELFPAEVSYLGLNYHRDELFDADFPMPHTPRKTELQPDILIGTASNTRQKDETRRYDGSDYELIPLTRDDYREMIETGINCLHVDARQLPWVADLNAFYWGVGGADIPYPECLYRSSYLGPALFLDEPAVVTRDYVIRPKLAKDEAFRKALTPQMAFEAFEEHFRHAWQEGAATIFIKGLAARPDVAPGNMNFLQENLFTWETLESAASYELAQSPIVPASMVWEPPGRVGTLRTLPELDMTYGCQLPVDDPRNFTEIIYGFLRGAARLTDKEWGTSIYGAVDRADAFWFLTHAYDLGATRFFFWDNGKQACVPYHECLALARNLFSHAANFPIRDLHRLKQAAEVAITLPIGYNLGHVALGKGSLWGLGELNLERTNSKGIKYRALMSNFFTEIERCLRLGVAFDLLWDLPGKPVSGYREIVRIREDGKVEVLTGRKRQVLGHARVPSRPEGEPPQLDIELSVPGGRAPLAITVRAIVHERAAAVFYTHGADNKGIYQNAVVAWELYGPGEADYRFLQPMDAKSVVHTNNGVIEAAVRVTLARPGNYRLRASTVDLAGRNTTVWKTIKVRD